MARMHHAILGPGGIGGLMGACLAHAGDRVTMVVRPTALADFPNQLHLESTFGTFDEAVERAASVPPADVLWITVKATQLEDALRSVPDPRAAGVGVMVPLLNGVDHIALLSERFGADRVIPATIAGEAERVAPGRFSHPAPFARLNVGERGRDRLAGTLAKLQKIGFTCQFVEDEATLMWSKIAFLAPVALTTSAAAAPIGEVIADAQRRRELEACVKEVCDVATAEHANVAAAATLAGILSLPPFMRSSMQKDVARGNPPELDAIAGPILRGAVRHGIPVPVTEALAASVERRVKSDLDSHAKAT
jgi:2-dehydropantoate 2-reductase